MPADVELGVVVTKKGDGADAVARDLKQAARAADELGDQLAQVDRKLIETRALMAGAAKEFNSAGNISPLRALLKDERQLNQVRKVLVDNLSNAGDEGGRSFLSRFGGQLSGGLGAVSGGFESSLITGLVAVAAAAAPAVGAAISAGVLLGLGAGTLAGGIIAAAQDPAVKTAYADLGNEIKTDLSGATAGFVDPLVRSAHTFSDVWNREVRPGLAQDFNALGPSIDHLSAGVGNFAHNVMPGFNQSIQASAPLLNQLGDDTLPRMGSAIGQFFSAIAQGGPGAQAFFSDLTTAADLSVKQLGSVTLALSKIYEEGRTASAGGALLTGTFNAWATGLERLDGGSKTTTSSFQLLNSTQALVATQAHQAQFAMDQEAAAMKTLAALTQNALGEQLSLAQANLGAAQAFQSVRDSVAAHGQSLKEDTADGLANRQALLGAVSALAQQRDAAISAAGGVNASKAAVDAANAKYEQSVGALLDMAGKLGLSRDQANQLAGALRSIPNIERTVTIDYLVTTTHRSVYIGGPSPYQQSASALLGGGAQGGIRSYASGGVDMAAILRPSNPGTLLAAEPSTGGEALIPRMGISDQRGLSLADTAARWHGGRVVPAGAGAGERSITVNVYAGWGANGAEIGQQVVQVLNKQLRTDPAAAASLAGALG